jgi:hypothetical protein
MANPDGRTASGLVSPAAAGAAAGGGDVRSLVLRAWLEPEVPRLRTRLVEIGLGRGERPVIVTTSVDEACRAVRNWLETLQAQGAGNNGDDTVTQKR